MNNHSNQGETSFFMAVFQRFPWHISLDELEDLTRVFEKSLEEFMSDIKSENPMHTILKGHLYIEHELREMLIKNLKYSNILNCDRLKFSELSKLVFSLGLLPVGLYPTVKAINNLRNSCSHNLKYKFDQEEFNKLEETFAPDFRKIYLSFLNSSQKPVTELIKLQTLLFTMWEQINSYNTIPEHIREKLMG